MMFELAHAFTAMWEGGLVDHPKDPGGVTNYGVSIRFLKDFAQKNPGELEALGVDRNITPDTIRELTRDKAKDLFKLAFWNPQKLDEFPRLTAIAHYDFSVNSGSSQAVRVLQRTVGTVVDGIIGPNTRRMTEEFSAGGGDLTLALAICTGRRKFCDELLLRKKGVYEPFWTGWMNRINALREYVTQLA